MKKLTTIVLVLILVIFGVLGFLYYKNSLSSTTTAKVEKKDFVKDMSEASPNDIEYKDFKSAFYTLYLPTTMEEISRTKNNKGDVLIHYGDPSDPYAGDGGSSGVTMVIGDKKNVKSCDDQVRVLQESLTKTPGAELEMAEPLTSSKYSGCGITWSYPVDGVNLEDKVNVHDFTIINNNTADPNYYGFRVMYFDSHPEYYKAEYSSIPMKFEVK